MASKYGNDHDTVSNDEDSDGDSDYLIASQISLPKHGTRSNTIDDFMKELNIQKNANDQFGKKISKIEENVMTSEFNSTTRIEPIQKDENIQQAMVDIKKMREHNTELLSKIKEYVKKIKVVEMNEKILEHGSEDTKLKELIKSELRKTEGLEQRLQDLTTKLNEQDKIIAMQISEYSKVIEAMKQNAEELKGGLKNLAKESKEKEARMAHKIDNLQQDMKQILLALQTNASTSDDGKKGTVKEEKSESSSSSGAKNTCADAKRSGNGQRQTELSRSSNRGTKVQPLTSKESKCQGKPMWPYTAGPPKKH